MSKIAIYFKSRYYSFQPNKPMTKNKGNNKMTFSQRAKEELASIYGESADAIDVQISAMLFFGRTSFVSGQILQTEHRCVAEVLIDLITESISPIMTLIKAPNPRRKDTAQYFLKIDSDFELAEVKANFMPSDFFERLQWQNNDISAALIRGVFLVCGSISDPQKEYHLEFVLYDRSLAAQLAVVLSKYNFPIKYTVRKNKYILYLKESEVIEDLLTFMGASKTSLSLMDVKVLKNVRNRVNRVTNCETANLEKTAVAAVNQLEDIRYLKNTIGFKNLPSSLEEAAKFREEFPELSLQELSEKIGSVSRSGLYHRFQRLHTLAEKERQKRGEG